MGCHDTLPLDPHFPGWEKFVVRSVPDNWPIHRIELEGWVQLFAVGPNGLRVLVDEYRVPE